MSSAGEGSGDALDLYELAACGLLTTAADGTIERVNRTMCAWTGFAAAELVGKRFQDLLTIGSKLFHYTHWMPLLQMQGSVAEVQLELVRRDGRVLPILVNAARRAGPAGAASSARPPVDVAVFIATDRRKYERELLLARKRAEELLASERQAQQARARAEARLRLALDSAHLRVWSVDVTTGARHYERDVASLLGLPPADELAPEAFAERIHPDDRAAEAAAFAAAIDPERRATYSIEHRLLGHDGVERIVRSTGRAFFDDGGKPVHFSGVIEDVTDRRRSEEALRQRENEFRTLAENSPDVIARFDRAHRYVYLSPAAEGLIGRPVEDLLGERVGRGGLGDADAAAWNAAIDEAFAGRHGTLAFSYEARDGRLREFQAHVVPERNSRGEIATVLGLTRDVTALRQQQREAQQRAILAEQLIGIVSHDLRNPLNAVLLGTQLLGDADAELQGVIAGRITAAADRAIRLIGDLLDFTQARLGGGLRVQRREIDLHLFAAGFLDELRLAWPGRRVEHRRTGDGLGSADPDRLAQILTNLVNNALTYGTPDEPVTVTTVVARDALEVRVHNTGRPIPQELQARIFEPMQRGAAQVGPGARSVGLGLYIVREIASAHGGRVSVRSTEREGTTFTVVLPRAQAAARASQG
ncbi:PAS domain-containing sensor histidine kinase [Sorangium sp. So ce406]|uniref:PAS domain-containing sensor histidine kinase n=1 Tax=Sorangium sp. So ce406 TaxID=3133311 RepID=UPI003F5C3BEF